jgi:hypothetical protein
MEFEEEKKKLTKKSLELRTIPTRIFGGVE